MSGVRECLENLLEDLEAMRSENYLQSIAQAREEYKQGKVTGLEELEREYGEESQ